MDCQLPVKASKEAIWDVITDFDHIVDNISGIIKAEVLERPPSPEKSLVGLKWTETRTIMGQESTETMWITESVVNEYYKTRAENCGAVYISTMYIEEKEVEQEDGTKSKQNFVGLKFEGQAETFWAKIMSALIGWMFMGETKKMLMKDLEDIKAKAEAST